MALDKVTVRIWMPHDMGIFGRFASAVGVGHASLTLRVNDKKYYVTWSAQGSPLAGFELDPFSKIHKLTKARDKESMEGFFNTYEPSYKVRLRTRQPNQQRAGLDAAAIERFWLDRLANRPKYAFLSLRQNCTGCVADALRAGGLKQYVPAPNNWFVQDAGSLFSWVLSAERELGVVH